MCPTVVEADGSRSSLLKIIASHRVCCYFCFSLIVFGFEFLFLNIRFASICCQIVYIQTHIALLDFISCISRIVEWKMCFACIPCRFLPRWLYYASHWVHTHVQRNRYYLVVLCVCVCVFSLSLQFVYSIEPTFNSIFMAQLKSLHFVGECFRIVRPGSINYL